MPLTDGSSEIAVVVDVFDVPAYLQDLVTLRANWHKLTGCDGETRLTGSDRAEQTDPFCVDSVNQPAAQPISPQSTAALKGGLGRDLFLDLCGDALPGALVHACAHCSTCAGRKKKKGGGVPSMTAWCSGQRGALFAFGKRTKMIRFQNMWKL